MLAYGIGVDESSGVTGRSLLGRAWTRVLRCWPTALMWTRVLCGLSYFGPVELMHHGGQAESRPSTRSPLTRRTVAAAFFAAARPERFSVALTGGQSMAPYRSGHVAMLQTICR